MPVEIAALIERLYDQTHIVIRAFRFREGLEPKAHPADFDDSDWVVDEQFHRSRGSGNCYGWFRATVVIPERVSGFPIAGSAATLLANIDDYGEIWVNGEMRSPVQGFDVDQRARLADAVQPGDRFQIALLAVNGYHATPFGGVFVRYARVEFAALDALRRATEGLIEELRLYQRFVRLAGAGAEALTARVEAAAAAIDWEAAARGEQAAFLASLAEARRALR